MNNDLERKETFNSPCANHHKYGENSMLTEESKTLIREQEERLSKIKAGLSIEEKIPIVTNNIGELLKYKNSKYGDSALNPVKIFSKTDATNGLLLRLDDKISRIKNNPELKKNDVADIMGYLILLCIDKNWLDFNEFKD